MNKLSNKKRVQFFSLISLKTEKSSKNRFSKIVGIMVNSLKMFNILTDFSQVEYCMKNKIKLMQKILAIKTSISIFFLFLKSSITF